MATAAKKKPAPKAKAKAPKKAAAPKPGRDPLTANMRNVLHQVVIGRDPFFGTSDAKDVGGRAYTLKQLHARGLIDVDPKRAGAYKATAPGRAEDKKPRK